MDFAPANIQRKGLTMNLPRDEADGKSLADTDFYGTADDAGTPAVDVLMSLAPLLGVWIALGSKATQAPQPCEKRGASNAA
jgi:hypothetical protein